MSIRKVKVARQGVPLSKRSAKAKPQSTPVGDNASARRTVGGAPGLGPALLRLQRKYGNRYVQKMLARISSKQKSDGQVQPKLVVNRAGDRFEQEANQVARALVQRDEQTARSAADGSSLHRQAEEDEKKSAQMQPEDKEKRAQLQPEEDEKTAQMKSEDEEVQRQTAEEDKKLETAHG